MTLEILSLFSASNTYKTCRLTPVKLAVISIQNTLIWQMTKAPNEVTIETTYDYRCVVHKHITLTVSASYCTENPLIMPNIT